MTAPAAAGPASATPAIDAAAAVNAANTTALIGAAITMATTMRRHRVRSAFWYSCSVAEGSAVGIEAPGSRASGRTTSIARESNFI
jgi:hypothetical protein